MLSYIVRKYFGGGGKPLEANPTDWNTLKEHLMVNTEFSNFIGTMAMVFGIWCAFMTIILLALVNKVYFRFNLSSMENLERVVDSILLDSNSENIEMLKMDFNDRVSLLNDFFLDRINTLELRISKIETGVNDYKVNFQSEHQNLRALLKKVPEVQNAINNMDLDLGEIKLKTNTLNKEITKISSSIDTEIFKVNRRIQDFKEQLNDKLETEELQLFKCNALLVNAKILFESSLIRFESVLQLLDTNNDTTDLSENKENILPGDASTKLEVLLNDGLRIIGSLNDNKNSACEIDSLLGHELGTSTRERDIEGNSAVALLFDVSKRIETVETQINLQERYIHQNFDKLRTMNTKHTEKISELKTHSEEWITAWVSVIYGLFNSTFMDLQNQLLGNDSFSSLKGFIETLSIFNNGDLFLEEFVLHCKDTCLKVMKEVSLLIFEYYLIHKNITKTGESILPICQSKISFEVDTLVSLFEETLTRTKINSKEYPKLRAEVSSFKEKLKHE